MENKFQENLEEPPAPPPWHGVKIPYGYEIKSDGVWYQPPTPPPSQRNPEPATPALIHICGPCWIDAQSRRYDSSAWGVHVHYVDNDGALKERNLSQFELIKSAQSARELIAGLGSDGLRVNEGHESKIVEYVRSFNSDARKQWTDQIGWLVADSMICILPEN
jgi:Domain of unknown function (DUF927)